MNVETTQKYQKTDVITQTQSPAKNTNENDGKFAEELKVLKKDSKNNLKDDTEKDAEKIEKEDSSSALAQHTTFIKEDADEKVIDENDLKQPVFKMIAETKKDKQEKQIEEHLSVDTIDSEIKIEENSIVFENNEEKQADAKELIVNQNINIIDRKNETVEKYDVENSEKVAIIEEPINTEIKKETISQRNQKLLNIDSEEEKLKNKLNDKTEEINDKNTINGAFDGLADAVKEIHKLNRTNEKTTDKLKHKPSITDKKEKHEDIELIDNNMNVSEPKDKLNLQMGANMNFGGNSQPFAEFVAPEKTKNTLSLSAKDLEEEQAILSTMEENVAIANKNMAMSKTKTIETEQGIKKVDRKTNVTVETIVSYETVVMDKADVDFFTKLVENGEVNMNEVQHSAKSSAVSKTLADLLAKSMQDNKPIRIDFDNDISVIIKVSRDGKISADFLPSSQVAEAYLKENLPLLRQRFDDNNIEYDELNHRKQKQDDQENRKKGRKDE